MRHLSTLHGGLIGLLLFISSFSTAEPNAAPCGTMVLRSRHVLYGVPVPVDQRYNFTPKGLSKPQPGISLLVREGFVVGHADRYRVPLWVAMRWTADDYKRSAAEGQCPRRFRPDPDLPECAQALADYEFAHYGLDRGHLARHKDNAAWGLDNSDSGCFMSNIAPQEQVLNRSVWLALEDLHREAVVDETNGLSAIWVVSGTVLPSDPDSFCVGNGAAVPIAMYKILAWTDRDERLHARGFLVPQDAVVPEPEEYLVAIDLIEALVGLDFFPDLPESIEVTLESETHRTVWP